MIADLAAALECSVADLTGQPHVPGDRRLEAAHARVEPVRRCLIEIAPDEPPARNALPVEALADRVSLLAERRLRSDYAAVMQMLPDLLIDLHSATVNPHRATALRLLVDATHTAMLTLRHLVLQQEIRFRVL